MQEIYTLKEAAIFLNVTAERIRQQVAREKRRIASGPLDARINPFKGGGRQYVFLRRNLVAYAAKYAKITNQRNHKEN